MAKPDLLSIVVPCYRSASYLKQTVEELIGEFSGWCPFEIVLVNDGSPDSVQEVIVGLASDHPSVRFLELGSNHGQHFATVRGFGLTTGDCVVTVDDDGQNPPSAIKVVSEALMSGSDDLVYGRFQTTEQSFPRRLASRFNRWMSKQTLGNQRGLSITNVRAIRGHLARVVAGSSVSAPYLDALIWRSTRRISEVAVEHRPRGAGTSTYTLFKLVTLWGSHLTLLTILPLQVASVGSMIVSVLSLFLALEQFIRALMLRQAPPGWLSIFLVVTLMFSVLFAFLAIISIYVGRIYVELNAKGLAWVRSSTPTEAARGDRG